MAGDSIIMSFAAPNYSGLLFNKSDIRTPFSTLIGGRRKYTDHVEFVTGQEYAALDTPAQPAISESASLTAPDATFVTREQKTNVTQIFMESVYISDAKRSNMGTLSGVNIAGQVANPIDELDFQIAAKMAKIANDIEYTFINGAYNKAAADNQINKSRGMITAITTNTIDADGAPLGYWMIDEMMAKIADANGDPSQIVIWAGGTARRQLNADCATNGLTIVPAARDINGIKIDVLLTSQGEVGIYTGKYLPDGVVGFFNPYVCAPVEQPVPGKGNFYLEELGKTGAGEKYQIFGQIGLDHGPEWMHGKITDLATTFSAPEGGIHVYVTNPPEGDTGATGETGGTGE